MFRNGDTELRLTDNEYRIIRDVLDHTVSVNIPPWPHQWVQLLTDKKDLDIICQLLLGAGATWGPE